MLFSIYCHFVNMKNNSYIKGLIFFLSLYLINNKLIYYIN